MADKEFRREDKEFRREFGQQLRVDSVRVSEKAGSGHPTSSMSAADLMAVLLDGYLRLNYDRPDDPHNDHLIFSKGHASPLYYSMLKAAGAVSEDEFLTYRRLDSRLEGHPTPRIPPTDVATRTLGQGLRSGSASRWPASAWTAFPTGSGCSVATRRWPKDRCGRRSSTRRTTRWTT